MQTRWLAVTLLGMALGAAGQTQPADDPLDLIRQANRSRDLGYDARAEAQYQRAVAVLERTAGPRAPHLIPALNGLAELYYSEQRYSEAEAYARRSAAVVQATLGPRDPLLATSLNDLAAIYHVQGQFALAEPLYERALAIRERALGPHHPFVAVTLVNLAELDRARGIYGRAALRYARAIQIEEQAYGRADRSKTALNSPGPTGLAGR